MAQTPASDPVLPGAVRVDAGRLTAVAYPADTLLARSLLATALVRDTFPGLARPRARVLVLVAPDAATFRRWIGGAAPEWGAAVAVPARSLVVVQGRAAASDAGDPQVVFRHELAHLALHESLGDLPPRWFDEGYASYAAGEWGREEVLATNLALLTRGTPRLDSLDGYFARGSGAAQEGYALAHQAVAALAALDPERGLALFFRYWKAEGRFDRAVRLAYGVTAESYERGWRDSVRRRYGTLALVANVGLVGGLAALLLGPVWLRRRRRDRERLAAMRAADAAADAAAAAAAERRAAEERALAELLGETPATREPGA